MEDYSAGSGIAACSHIDYSNALMCSGDSLCNTEESSCDYVREAPTPKSIYERPTISFRKQKEGCYALGEPTDDK